MLIGIISSNSALIEDFSLVMVGILIINIMKLILLSGSKKKFWKPFQIMLVVIPEKVYIILALMHNMGSGLEIHHKYMETVQ